MKHSMTSLTLAALALLGGVAHAQSVEIKQTGALHTGSYLDTYYVGGYAGNTYTSGPLTGQTQYGPGPNLGFTFSANANVQSKATNAGKFENLPTGDLDGNTQVLYFSALGGSTTVDTVNFAAGFSGVTFNYSLSANNANYAGTASVWSGLNGTGNLLATIPLRAASTTTACTTQGDVFCTWSAASSGSLAGVGQSVTFGVANSAASVNTEIDAFTVTAVPEPSALWLMPVGVAGLVGVARRARSTKA